MSTYQEYFRLSLEYRERYGESTVVLMQVGDFMEMYALPEREAGWNSAECLEVICAKLGIVRTFKNKKNAVCDLSNPMMAGFQVWNTPRFVRILVRDHGYTVVEVEQTDRVLANKLRERRVKRVISPGTFTEDAMEKPEEHNIVAIYADCHPTHITFGFSAADLSTGVCSYDEVSVPPGEVDACLARYFIQSEPREALLIIEGDKTALCSVQECSRGVMLADHSDRFKREHKAPGFQNVLLSKVYRDTGMLSAIEYLDLERMVQARYSFCYLVQFLLEQAGKERLRLEIPTNLISKKERMVLSNDSAEQLNLIDGKRGVLSLLNRCKTPMGKRRMRRCLLAPFLEESQIRARHDAVEALLTDPDRLSSLRGELHGVGDLERLLHKSTLYPQEMCHLGTALSRAEAAFRLNEMVEEKELAAEISAEIFEKIHYEVCNRFNPNGIWENCFREGVYPALDRNTAELVGYRERFRAHVARTEGLIALSDHDRDGLLLTVKKSARAKIANYLAETGLMTKPTGNKLILSVTSEELLQANNDYLDLRQSASKSVREVFEEFVRSFRESSLSRAARVVEAVERLDYDAANALNARELCLSRPQLASGERSFFRAKQLRHPLIEHLQKDVRYVANDVSLHCGVRQEEEELPPQGVLLYGVNASGKSSLMKSVGIAVAMAQAGMYVAAEELHLGVFHSIYTRILNTDNVYKGQSTFVREMSEMRTILTHGDPHVLVIGDELCSGTETRSAVALVGAGIDAILQSGACFLIATHLHELQELPEITGRANVRVCHLSVTFDEVHKKIYYDRVLREGGGRKMYGMEVCRSLNMPAHFLSTAERIRGHLLSEQVNPKPSRYNSRMYLNQQCAVCGTEPAQEVHHIVEQKFASNNKISNYHKNTLFNLAPLCKRCHSDTHRNLLSIEGYKSTSKGVELIIHQPTTL